MQLPRGHCRIGTIAAHRDVDRSTVARHLAAEGTTFTALVDALRSDHMSRYVKNCARSLSDVSALLGFSEPTAFSRWHRQRFGVAACTRVGARR